MCLESWKAPGLKACSRDLCSEEGECCSEENTLSPVEKAMPLWKQTVAWPKLGLELPLRHRGTEQLSFIQCEASSLGAVPPGVQKCRQWVDEWAVELRVQTPCLEMGLKWEVGRAVSRALSWTAWLDRALIRAREGGSSWLFAVLLRCFLSLRFHDYSWS